MTANPVAELNFSGRGMNFVSNPSNYRGTIKSDCAPKAREFFWGVFGVFWEIFGNSGTGGGVGGGGVGGGGVSGARGGLRLWNRKFGGITPYG